MIHAQDPYYIRTDTHGQRNAESDTLTRETQLHIHNLLNIISTIIYCVRRNLRVILTVILNQ